jgi:hypothetical protein
LEGLKGVNGNSLDKQGLLPFRRFAHGTAMHRSEVLVRSLRTTVCLSRRASVSYMGMCKKM